MLILYVKTGCLYSAHVREAAAELGIPLEERNIDEKESYYDELMKEGGDSHTPFLVDEEKGVQMYESEKIIAYLKTHYQKNQ